MTGPLWGALPDGWLAGQVKNAATVTLGKMLQSKDSGSDVRAPYMRAANVQPDGVLALHDVNEMWFGDAELEQLSIRAGDVVVVEGGQGGFGRAAYVDEDLPGWGFQNSINRLRPIGDFDGRFIAYYLIALRGSGFIRAYSNVVSMPHLTAEKLARIPMPLPHPEEQRAVADYLDRETARIDTLIEEQQRLVEMLRERRDGVVTKAFLNSTSEERALKFAVDDVTVGIVVQPSRWYVDAGVPALRGVNVKRGSISLADLVNISEEGHAAHRKSQLRSGDVVVVRTGQAGAAAKIPDELDGANAIDILIVRPGEGIDPDFLVWYLNSPLAASRIEHGSVGALQGHFNVSALRELPLPNTPLAEQQRIVTYLDEQIAKIDTTIAETERFIELARERRAALITAAVTGQIEVREMA
ncbi:restriction endonuclease subunit S [Amycolatopsis rhizosphaerae]|uniref:Restriction endonuclease subunit S n=1 Tax=Amycolatopsis rhizosphaerae TaxID=2053003 RepID=A0A558DLL2_9PSEU|nr:restriction endonuclease subunit S [Amycolatopsis rhizosphaerae]TVT61909.1 restriction endonuclease subunit S [Amycolatopsis rhizosphaerae]